MVDVWQWARIVNIASLSWRYMAVLTLIMFPTIAESQTPITFTVDPSTSSAKFSFSGISNAILQLSPPTTNLMGNVTLEFLAPPTATQPPVQFEWLNADFQATSPLTLEAVSSSLNTSIGSVEFQGVSLTTPRSILTLVNQSSGEFDLPPGPFLTLSANTVNGTVLAMDISKQNASFRVPQPFVQSTRGRLQVEQPQPGQLLFTASYAFTAPLTEILPLLPFNPESASRAAGNNTILAELNITAVGSSAATPGPSPGPAPGPTPAPPSGPTPAAVPTPAPSPAPAPTPVLTPTPTPVPTPVPTPTPAPIPASPVSTPAPTLGPAPAPSPTPGTAPAPAPSPLPIPVAAPTPSPTLVPSISTPSSSPTP